LAEHVEQVARSEASHHLVVFGFCSVPSINGDFSQIAKTKRDLNSKGKAPKGNPF
jgi:hypothetical protein